MSADQVVRAVFSFLGHFQVELAIFVLGYIVGCWISLSVMRQSQ